MKRVAVLRHAKSSWDDADREDFERPLNDRGREAARRLGRALKTRNRQFDLVLASTAVRARETIEGVRQGFDFKVPVRFEPQLYQASEGTLLSLLRALPESVTAPLLVGHNPALQRLAIELTSADDGGLRDRVEEKFPTAALAVVELSAERWANLTPRSGTIVELILPRELD